MRAPEAFGGPITGVAVWPPGQSGSVGPPFLAGGGYSKCFFHRISPLSASIAYTLSDTPVSSAICLGPLLVFTLPIINSGKRECICRGVLSSFSFQRIFSFPTLSFVSSVSSLCQLVRCGFPPSVGQ